VALETILIALENRTNSRLIADLLRKQYSVHRYMGEKRIPPLYDLIITDGFTLSFFREKHIPLKNDKEYLFRPVLLVTPKKDVNLITGQVWQDIDEVITAPISKMELLVRVETLLYYRRKSVRLKEKSALLALDIGRLRDETEMLVDSFANISHELRTPLTVMLAGIESMTAQLTKGGLSPEESLHSLRIMKHNSLRLLRIITNLLDIIRIDAGGMSLFLRNLDLKATLSRIVESVGDYARLKQIDLSFASSAKRSVIAVDEDKFDRIMLNLLSNAIKFTGAGGKIQLCLQDGRDGETVVIAVEDDGPGIPPEIQGIIFERFRQGDAASKTGAGGCGLGLSLVNSLVELHGGRVFLESAPGKGSTFFIELPVKTLAAEGPQREGAGLESQIDLELSDLRPKDAKAPPA
jgi:signal transduction histidine kinase